MQFPNLWKYTAILAERDQGIAMVISCVLIAVAILAYARGWWPRALAVVRVTCAALFYVSFFTIAALKAVFHG